MALAQTIKHWATYLPIPEPIVYRKQGQKRGSNRHTWHISLRRAYRGSHLLCTARTRYIRLHTPTAGINTKYVVNTAYVPYGLSPTALPTGINDGTGSHT
jgi:hypothetical protein